MFEPRLLLVNVTALLWGTDGKVILQLLLRLLQPFKSGAGKAIQITEAQKQRKQINTLQSPQNKNHAWTSKIAKKYVLLIVFKVLL